MKRYWFTRMRYLQVYLLFSVIGFAIYSNTLYSPFVYDDYDNIINNPIIIKQELTWGALKDILSSDRPVSLFTFAFNSYLGGLDPYGYHLFNIVVHIFTAIGFFLLFEGTLTLSKSALSENRFIISFIAGILWLTNPLQTQAVTYIVQRMASMAAMFYVWSLFFYYKMRVSKDYTYFFLTVIFGLLAFGTKQNTYTLPFCILVYELLVIRKGDVGFLLNKKRLILISAVTLIFIGTLWYLYYDYFSFRVEIGLWLWQWIKTRFLTGLRVILFYITQLLLPLPSRLCLLHDFKLSRSLLNPPSTVIALISLSSLIYYSVAACKKQPIISFFIFWFFVNIAIETFNPQLFFMFEHRLYLPSMGFFAIAAIAICSIFTLLSQKRNAIILALIIVALYSFNTYIRNMTWKDKYSLWGDVINKNPWLAEGYVGIGNAFVTDGDYEDAINYLLKANSINPRDPVVFYQLGVAYFRTHRYDDAITWFSSFGSLGSTGPLNQPPISYYFAKIAKNYYGHGRVKAALDVIGQASKYDPYEPTLKELKEKMENRTITFQEIMQP